MKRIGFLLLAIAILASLAAAVAGCGGSANAASKTITVYTALEDDQITAYLASFKTQHPDIDVKIVRDSTGIITSKLLAEKDNPVADVAWGIAATSLLVCDQQGMLEPYSPVGVDKVQASFKDKNNPTHWVGIDAWMTAFTVNTQEAAKAGVPVPKSYADLLDPKYKGMIVMPDPNASGTGFLTVSGWLQIMGQDKGWQYMKDLDKNIAYYVDSGSKPAKLAASGECVIGISFDYRGITLKQSGAPVDVVFPAEKSGWDVEANALIKKKTINPTAKIFLDWAISDPVMQEYFKNYPITSVKISNPIPDGYPADPVAQLCTNDLYWGASNRAAILKQWSDDFGSKVKTSDTTAPAATDTTVAPAATTPSS
jgi:iron(III) transport system substrate-binding protein